MCDRFLGNQHNIAQGDTRHLSPQVKAAPSYFSDSDKQLIEKLPTTIALDLFDSYVIRV